MLAKGDRNGAGQLFAKIAADKQVPQIHSQPRGPDRRLAGRRRHGVAAGRSRRHSCPIGHDHHASRNPRFTFLPDGLAARRLQHGGRRRVQEEGQDHRARRARRGAGQRSRHRDRPGDRGAADEPAGRGRQRRAGPSRAATPRKSIGHVALGQSLGVAWTVSIGKGSDKDGRLGGGAGGRRRQGLHDGHAAARSARSTPATAARSGRRGSAKSATIARRSTAAASPSTTAGSMPPTASAMSPRSTPTNGGVGVDGQAGRPVARRADGRRRRRLCDEPGQPDLFAQDRRRHDQLVERRGAGDRRRVRRRPRRRSARGRSSPASRRASSTPIATRMAARCGRTPCRGPA